MLLIKAVCNNIIHSIWVSVKDEDVKSPKYAEMSILVRWVCTATVRDSPTSVELRRLRMECINELMRIGRLWPCGKKE